MKLFCALFLGICLTISAQTNTWHLGSVYNLGDTISLTNASGGDVTSGLIHEWKLNGDWTDSAGANPGTSVGSPTFINDKNGNANSAISLNGTSQYATISVITLSGAFSITYWFYAPTEAANYYFAIGNTATTNVVKFGLNNDGASLFIRARSTIYTPSFSGFDVWHFLVVKRDAVNLISYSLDGSAATSLGTESDNTYVGILGTGYFNTTPTSFWKGYLDDIRIYNRAITDAEISTLDTNGPQ